MAQDTRNDLMTDDPTPFSSRMNWPLLSNKHSHLDLDKVPQFPFSRALGLPLLTDKQTSSTHLKTDDPTPFSSRFNWPVLSDKQMSNTELKTDNPTPLSSMLGLPLLTESSRSFRTSNTRDGSEHSRGRSRASGDGAVGRFVRGVVSGEPQR